MSYIKFCVNQKKISMDDTQKKMGKESDLM